MATSAQRTLWTIFLAAMLIPMVVAQTPAILDHGPEGIIADDPVILSITTDIPSACRADTTDGSYDIFSLDFDGTGTAHTLSLDNLTDGSYVYFAHCQNDSNATNASTHIQFTVDRTGPVISDTAPSGTLTQGFTTLSLDTSEDATCRYDDEDLPYAELEGLFEDTGGVSHSHVVRELVQGEYRYYVGCEDTAGNPSSAATILFMVNLPPTAQISGASTSGPMKSGTYKITLVTSEPLAGTPTLQYDFNDDAAKKPVSLIGGQTKWTGYLLIEDDTPNKIGTFYFTGTDEQGVTGTEITDGKLFLVDTTKPPAPIDVAASLSQKRKIKVEWYYDGEDIDHYNIYRSSEPGVDYTDYLDDAESDAYTDKHVDEFYSYYYRISAVDEAGNEGPLSEEVEGYALDRATALEDEEEEERSILTPPQLKKINDTIRLIEKDILDVDRELDNLEDEDDPDTIEVIAEMDLVTKTKNVKLNLENLIFELQNLQSEEQEDTVLEKTLDQYKQNALKYTTDVPLNIIIRESTSFQQAIDQTDQTTAIAEATLGLGLDEGQLGDYTEAAQSLGDGMTVTTELLVAEVSFMNTEVKKEISLVKKTLVSTEERREILLLELVPKSVARRASEITFKEDPEVLKEDPILQWKHEAFTAGSIVYSIPRAVDVTNLRMVQTIPVPDPAVFFQAGQDNQITGNAPNESIKEAWQLDYGNALIVLGIFIALGLVVYYFFFMKSEEVYGQAAESGSPVKAGKLWEKIMDVKDRLHKRPLVISRPETPSMHIPDEEAWHEFSSALQMAHLHANNLQQKESYDHYVRALNSYHGLSDPSLKEDGTEELNRVYSKLTLLQLLRKGHAYVDKRNVIKLREVMLSARELLDHMDTAVLNTPLDRHARQSESYFLHVLSGMEAGMDAPRGAPLR